MAKKRPDNHILILAAGIVLVLGGGIAIAAYVAASGQTVYIEKSALQAPVVDLAPAAPGILKDVYVNVGDTIAPNTVVAAVGTQLIKSTVGGLVATVNNDIGKDVGPQDTIVKMIDPKQLRVVGQLEEDKGLKDIKVGDPAIFTVDAFGSREFTGVVEEISPTSHAGGVAFSISDKRATQRFDVKVRFDESQDPGFKNGMSAEIWVYKQ